MLCGILTLSVDALIAVLQEAVADSTGTLTVISVGAVEAVPECGNLFCETGEDNTHCAADCRYAAVACPNPPWSPDECGGAGICRAVDGSCSCFVGYAGNVCDECVVGYLADSAHACNRNVRQMAPPPNPDGGGGGRDGSDGGVTVVVNSAPTCVQSSIMLPSLLAICFAFVELDVVIQ
jgi:hypothetical protein